MDSWKQYQTERFHGAIPDECNFAVVCGDVSDNLVVFDFDQCDDIKIVDQVFPNVLQDTLVVQTNRGFHAYFKTNHLPKPLKIAKGNLLIDLQSTGKYVVGPTSIHPNGTEYRIISSTTKIMLIDCRAKLEDMIELGYEVKGLTDMPDNGHEIARGGVKNGYLHNSLVKYCNHLLFTVGINDWHTYCVETDRWNQPGNNEFQINQRDFERVRKDAWEYYHKKKTDLPEKDPKDKTPADYVEEIMIDNKFKTLEDTDELLVYRDGVYVIDPQAYIIRSECEKIIPDCNTRICNEIIDKIKRKTFVNRNDFDYDVNIINLKNGLLNIVTGELTPHTPLYLSRIQIPIEYKPDKVPHKFLKYISECLPDPVNLILAMEGFASCLLRTPRFEKAFMFIGTGANGKSTFLEIMTEFLGQENTSHVSIHDLTEQRFAKAELNNKLANIYADVESKDLEDTGILKALISGDSLTVEKKHQQPYKMRSYAKMFFSANRFPEVLDQSNALFRKFVIIEWVRSFLKTKDTKLKQSIIEDPDEMSGILNILVRLARDLERRGVFKFDRDIEVMRKTWNEKADPIRKFIEDYLVFGENYQVDKASLYEAYVKFCKEQNIMAEYINVLMTRIKQLTKLEDDQRREGDEVVRIFTGGTLRSKLRSDKQNAL